MTGEDIAAAAQSLVGTPFRLCGREPGHALDCVGVVEAALAKAGCQVLLPTGYTLRALAMPDTRAIGRLLRLASVSGAVQPGDVLMLAPRPYQLHFAIGVGGSFCVHAHAGLRKVVQGPLPVEWPVLGQWRAPSIRMTTWQL